MVDQCTRRHVLVTGASSGNGQAATLRFAGVGDHVYATVRSETDAEALRRPGITPILMDVTNHDQIQRAVKTISEHTTQLDVLINNAGIGLTGPTEFIPLESFRLVFEVNVIGQIAVTQAMLPLLRAARGMIVMIGSIGDRLAIPFGGPLTSSKFALRSLSDVLRRELAPWNIRVVLIEPGSIRTPAVDKTLPDDWERVLDSWSPEANRLYGAAYSSMRSRFRETELAGDPPVVIANAILRAVRAKRPRASYLAGKDAGRLAMVARLPPFLVDRLVRRLFDLPRPGSAACE